MQEKKERKKKVCPMMSRPLLGIDGPWIEQQFCLEDLCAWWSLPILSGNVQLTGRCAILEISDSLYDMIR